MNDKEFQKLRRQIHKKMVELIALQKLHNRETGQDYIVSGPLPDSEGQAVLEGIAYKIMYFNNDETITLTRCQ